MTEPRFRFTKIFACLSALLILSSAAVGKEPNLSLDSPPANPLFVDPASRDFSENPELLERVLSGPHGYFRFINITFSQEVCRRFAEVLSGTPSLNLHGDAHLEQYAVTDLGRGLTDFDDSSTGPAIIDLMRFGVSLELTCAANNWPDKTKSLFDAFLKGYRAALKNPQITVPPPVVVQRIRSRFTVDREKYFQWIVSIMEPMPEGERDSLVAALQPYIETKLAEDSTLTSAYFAVQECGYLRMGIGSALDMKYLIRIRGASEEPLDDVVLEAKEVRDLRGIDCINTGQELDPFRILLGQTRIAYQPFEHLGYFRFNGHNFWMHSWVDNYKEVKIQSSFTSPAELAEVVYDIGVQLGKGHVKHIAAPLDLQLRREQQQFLKNNEATIRTVRQELTRQTIAAWEQFCGRMEARD